MRRKLIVLVALATLLAGGCGIPENGPVTVVGDGPTRGTSVGDDGTMAVPPTRQSATDPAQLAEYYLQAAAGDPETGVARVKAFMSPDAATAFKPVPDVRVIRPVQRLLYTPGDPEITLRVQVIGTLKSNGVLEPVPDPTLTPSVYKLRYTEEAGKGFFITSAPPALLLADTALTSFYQRRTIYFWNTEQTELVPDLRYMPRGIPTVQQPTTILGWLANGPSRWLNDQVRTLEPGTVPSENNVPAITNDTLQVKLGAQAVPSDDPKQLDLLRRQLQWSLGPLLPHILELQIGHQDPVQYSEPDFRDSNAAYRLAETPQRFLLFNGVVRRRADEPRAGEPVPVLKQAENKNIVEAAMSGSDTHTVAAVVTDSGRNQKLRVAAAAVGQQAALKDVGGLPGQLGRPVWVSGDGAGATGLITADGRLYSFTAKGSAARRVEWQGDPGRVTSLSVAPDGTRVALVSGGKLYRALLSTTSDGVTLSTPEQLLPATLATVAAVSWSSENWLTVAGVRSEDGRVSIMDVTIDGALQVPRLADIGDKTVSYLATYPAGPTSGKENTDMVSYMAAGSAWDAASTPLPIRISDLAGTTPNPPAGMTPTAPFFLG